MPISNTSPDQQIWVARNNGGAGFVSTDRDGSDNGVNSTTVYQGSAPFIRPNDMVFDTVHGLFFVADSVNGNRRILQGNISDLQNPSGPPPMTILYSDSSPGTAGGQILGLAIDVDAATGQGHLYFVNQRNLARISYDHDGTSPTNQTAIVLAQVPAGSFANEIALDIANHRAFILSTASSNQAVEVPEGTPGAIYDEDSGVWFIIATNITNNEIWQVSGLDRTDSSTAGTTTARLNFVGGDNGGQDLQDAKGLLQSIDIDPTTGLLYFTTQQINSGVFGETGGIFRYNLATGTYETLYTEGNATDYSFEYIDVDPVTGRYYVTNASFDDTTNANTSSVLVHALSAGAPTHFASVGNAAGAIPQGVIVVNAPTLNAVEASATTTESAGAGSGPSSPAIAVTAPDAHDGDTAGQIDELAGAKVRISTGFGASPGHAEQLTINGTTSGTLASGIAYSYNSGTGVMVLTGAATFDEYEAALALVAYAISGDDPDNGGTAPTRTLSYSVSDGLMWSDEFDATIAIVATNDAPVNTTGGGVSASEDDAAVAISGLSVSDADSGALTVTLAVARGTLAVATVAGGAAVSGSGTGSVQLTGSQAEINATLSAANGVSYTPTPNVNGADTLTMTTDDGTDQDVDLINIGVAAVNDAPTVSGDGSEEAAPIVEDEPSATGQTVSALFGGQYSDGADQVAGGSSADAFAGVAVTANGSSGASGQWQYHNGAAWVDIGPASSGAAVLLSAGTSVRFNPALDFVGAAPTLTVHLVDASGGAIASGSVANLSATGGTTSYSSGTVVLSQQVLDGNEPPTGVTGTLSVEEFPDNGTVVGTVSGQDPDSSVFTYALVNDAGGRFDIDANTGVVTVQDGLLIDYEQQSSHTIRVAVTDDEGATSEFDMVVGVTDEHGEFVIGDARDNVMVGGAEIDIFIGGTGSDTLSGGGGSDILIGGTGIFDFGTDGDHLNGNGGFDILYGGGGNDRLDGGAQSDVLIGGAGNDVFVFRKGEANGDVILDFDGNGAAAGDTIVLEGYAAGTTFTRIGSTDVWRINDHGSIELVTIHGDVVHPTDYSFVP
jgi:Ca2+-binding RTX toxin-like protein